MVFACLESANARGLETLFFEEVFYALSCFGGGKALELILLWTFLSPWLFGNRVRILLS